MAQNAPRLETPRDLYQFLESFSAELSSGGLQLPAFPDALMRIRDLLADGTAPMPRVVRAMQLEPVFTASLIKLANSVLYARGGPPLTDVGTAVNRLGYELVCNLAITEATRQLTQPSSAARVHAHLKRLWKHSVLTAALAMVLARRYEGVNPDLAMMAGLVHDIGKAYVLNRVAAYCPGGSIDAQLSQFIADWHASIGSSIVEHWGLPDSVVAATEEHENLDLERGRTDRTNLVDLIIAANIIANRPPAPPRTSDDAIEIAAGRLQLDVTELWSLVQNSATDIRAIVETLR
jgi:putative nucleotidyltransferase with HDIG domain